MKRGQLYLTTGLTDHEIKAPALLTMGPNVIRKWTQTFKAAENETIFFTKEFLLTKSTDVDILNRAVFYEHADLHVFHLHEKDRECIDTLFDALKRFINSDYKNKDALVKHQIALLHIICDELHSSNTNDHQKAEDSVTYEFKQLAAHNIKTHRDVAWYANRLHLSAKILSEKMKLNLGKTASQFLHDLMILEAKIMLQNPNMTISETAYALNFSDPSTFGKYFKKYAGVTPSKYQEQL
ncbi:helix-turn-helix domain-containing protein [Maribacter sp. 2307ULW6-5]|uniref:helix-turn-helix domain-containing protein n=1 Tax=Maribacter sp. 2307ULW6-5 TaxID=3386275 RepID=UPI0039BD3B36